MGQSLDSDRGFFGDTRSEKSLIHQLRDLETRVQQLARAALVAGTARDRSAPQSLELRIRQLLKLRAGRAQIFGQSLFGEPAWDMLLELYAAQLGNRNVSVSSICLASGVPATTALRWLNYLEQEEWVRRWPDATDRRRFFVGLTEKAKAALERFFAQPAFANGV